MNQTEIKQILAERGLAPSKRLGQNFLTQPHIARQIVAAARIKPGETVVELGVGLGSLTHPLAAQAGRVVGLEIDSGIIDFHRETGELPENVELRHQDLLTADFAILAQELGGRLKILANLPYSLTNPLLFKLVEQHQALELAVLMVQKEVALRLSAKPGSKEYGVLSVLLGGCASVKRLMEVGPGNFYPRPKVDSLVIAIHFRSSPEIPDLPSLRQVVDLAFRQRRKTLLNSLSAGGLLALSREQAAEALAAVAIDPRLRAENLTTDDYLRLSSAITTILEQ